MHEITAGTFLDSTEAKSRDEGSRLKAGICREPSIFTTELSLRTGTNRWVWGVLKCIYIEHNKVLKKLFLKRLPNQT